MTCAMNLNPTSRSSTGSSPKPRATSAISPVVTRVSITTSSPRSSPASLRRERMWWVSAAPTWLPVRMLTPVGLPVRPGRDADAVGVRVRAYGDVRA